MRHGGRRRLPRAVDPAKNRETKGEKKRVGADTSALASCVAAVVTCCVLHPLDLIKTRLQVSAVTAGAIPTYSSSAHAFREIWRLEGCRGLWKGVSATAAASGLSWGIFRYLFDVWRYQLASLSPAPSPLLSPSASSSSVSASPSVSASNPTVSAVAGAASAATLHAPGPQDASGAERQADAENVFVRSPLWRRHDKKEEGEIHAREERARQRGGRVASAPLDSKHDNDQGKETRKNAADTRSAASEATQDRQGDPASRLQDEKPSSGESEMDNVAFRANLAASVVAGFFSTVITHPLWLVKARMEMQAYETLGRAEWPHYRNPVDCLLSIRRSGGFSALYAGLGPAVMLVPHAAVQILVYEEMKKRAEQKDRDKDEDRPFHYGVKPFVWGAVSKCIAITATYPLQVLRARQQVANTPYSGKNFLQIAYFMLRKEGFPSLFGGYLVHLQRACLQNGIMFLIFEQLVGSLQPRG